MRSEASLRLVSRLFVTGISARELKGKYRDDNKELYFVAKFFNNT